MWNSKKQEKIFWSRAKGGDSLGLERDENSETWREEEILRTKRQEVRETGADRFCRTF